MGIPYSCDFNKEYQSTSNELYKVHSVSMRGRRKTQEDRHLIDFKTNTFGLFDGHNGTLVSDTLKQKIPTVMTVPNLKKAFRHLDEEINKELEDNLLYCGSTCVSATVYPNSENKTAKVIVCNVGDSRLYHLDSDLQIIRQITKDHNLSDPNEKKRFKDLGTTIQGSRVYGPGYPHDDRCSKSASLNLTRAFGDAHFKKIGLTVDPDIFRVDIKSSEYLMFVCDGLTEGISSNRDLQEAIDICKLGKMSFQHLDDDFKERFVTRLNATSFPENNNDNDSKKSNNVKNTESIDILEILKRLVDYSVIIKKSTDNHTILLVEFCPDESRLFGSLSGQVIDNEFYNVEETE